MVDRFERFSLAISEINRYWHRLTTQEMEPYGLKGAHCMYLLALARHPEGITAPRLCEACDKDKADVSRTMALLEQAVAEGVMRPVSLPVLRQMITASIESFLADRSLAESGVQYVAVLEEMISILLEGVLLR